MSRLLAQRCRGHARNFSLTQRRGLILGLESSCDDTGAAVICPESGRLMGEAVNKQLFSSMGGVIPSIAMGQHAKAFPKVVEESLYDVPGNTLDEKMFHISTIAVTNRPGLAGSLLIGTRFAKYLSRRHRIPILPIHHMEAHALTARMTEQIEFPFMVFLISGGHCILALAEDVDRFKMLGQTEDNSPGEALDKVARLLRLHAVRPELRDVPGGRAVEIVAAEGGDPKAVEFPLPKTQYRDCSFSFSGLKSTLFNYVEKQMKLEELPPDHLLKNASDIAASFQFAVARHLCHRLQRAFEYCERKEIWPEPSETTGWQKTLVVSGGVASNSMIKTSLLKVCETYSCQLVAPPSKYCTDNGVMIAWNALEKIRRGKTNELVHPENAILGFDIQARSQFGEDISEEVVSWGIKCKPPKIL